MNLQTSFPMGVCNHHMFNYDSQPLQGIVVQWLCSGGGVFMGVLFNLSCFNNTLVSHVLDVWKLWFQLPFEMEMVAASFSETQHGTIKPPYCIESNVMNTVLKAIWIWLGKQNILVLVNIGVTFWSYIYIYICTHTNIITYKYI